MVLLLRGLPGAEVSCHKSTKQNSTSTLSGISLNKLYLLCSEESEISKRGVQGCGLDLDVSVSIRPRDVPTSRLGVVSTTIILSACRFREADISVLSRPFTSCA